MEFTLKILINATAERIYKFWLSSDGNSHMTGGEAITSAVKGGGFTAWDGYIWGKNIELEPYSRIVQAWRTTQFKDNEENSLVEISLREIDGETELTLHHTDVPEGGEHYKSGWEIHYFEPMKEYFKLNP
jgi:activator of HSP90 ATPase